MSNRRPADGGGGSEAVKADWDAARYDRVSDPQFEWGRRVVARLDPQPGERVLDLGCGTGRVTAEIATAVRGGLVVGFDRSSAMLAVARRTANASTASTWWVRGDGVRLPFASKFDAVFTTATLHWIADHAAVFAGIFDALRPGGRLVGQCGGGANLDRLYRRAAALMRTEPFAPWFSAWRNPWHFALPEPTHALLHRSGFVDVHASLESAPVTFDDGDAYAEFISCVCVRDHLERMPLELQAAFASALTEAASKDTPPYTLDYWRLNIDARRPSA
jgi:trans-aconitate 2-methyltransferase